MKNIFGAGLCILITLLSFGQNTHKQNNTMSTSTILFVCEHGAARSTIAAAYFNQQQGLNYQAIFRGINAGSALGPAAQKGLYKRWF